MTPSPHPPRFLDLFCGIGGLSLGLQQAGFVSVGGIDHCPDALATYRRNHPLTPVHQADLSGTTVSEIEEAFGLASDSIEVVVGGPPCQGFSTVGKRQTADPRNQLWSRFLDLVSRIRPAYVLMENVEGLNVIAKGEVRDRILEEFPRAGYRMKAELLRAASFGVPQLRKRMFFLGWLDGLVEPRFPSPFPGPDITVADALFDLPPLRAGETKSAYENPAVTPYQKARRKQSATLFNHEAAKHPPDLVGLLRHIPDGGNRKAIPDHLQPRSGFHNSYARLASWKPAIAVTSNMRKPSSARATHPTQPRGLTVREGLRLQSFDDDFVVLGSRTAQYLQVGNAVPPLLARAVGEELLRAYRANTPEALAAARRKRLRVQRLRQGT